MWEDKENQVQSQEPPRFVEEHCDLCHKVQSQCSCPRELCDIAEDIFRDWKTMTPYAKPYAEAMLSLGSINDSFFQDSAKSVVLYFLSNASTWRGETAKRIKAELKSMLKGAK